MAVYNQKGKFKLPRSICISTLTNIKEDPLSKLKYHKLMKQTRPKVSTVSYHGIPALKNDLFFIC